MITGGEPTAVVQSRAKIVGRWIAVLPGALLCVLVAMFPVHWVVLLGNSGSEGDGTLGIGDIPDERLEAWLMGLVLPWVFVTFGAKIAPRQKAWAAGVLGAGWLVVYSAAVAALVTYVSTSDDELYFDEWGLLQVASVVALNFVGAIAGFVQVLKESQS